MQIVCPNCSARYLAPDDQIGPEGRRVRCAKCGHVWQSDPPPLPDPEPEPEVEPPPDPEPEPPPDPEPEPPESDSREADTPETDGLDAEPVAPLPTDAPAPEDARIEGADAEAGDPADPATPAGPAEADASGKTVRIEPLPRNRLPAPQGAGLAVKRSLPVGWIVFLLVVAGLAAGFFFGRDAIMQAWPPSTKLYEAVGLSEAVGTMPQKAPELEVSDLANVWEDNDDGLSLILGGRVTNHGRTETPAPYIRIRLFNHDGKIVRDKREPLAGGPIEPGETREFDMRFKDPGDVARAIPVLEPIR